MAHFERLFRPIDRRDDPGRPRDRHAAAAPSRRKRASLPDRALGHEPSSLRDAQHATSPRTLPKSWIRLVSESALASKVKSGPGGRRAGRRQLHGYRDARRGCGERLLAEPSDSEHRKSSNKAQEPHRLRH
jgi:hypothetical protein